MSFGSNTGKSDLIGDSNKIPITKKDVVLGVTIENRLTFYSQLKIFCRKNENKLNALKRIASYVNHNQIRLTCNSFLRDSLAIVLLFGQFALGVQIILLTNFKNEH